MIEAHAVGRAVGGPKLAPSISPGKTQSGALGGAVGGVERGVASSVLEVGGGVFDVLDGVPDELLELTKSSQTARQARSRFINRVVGSVRIGGQNAPSMFPSPRDRGLSAVKVARICAPDQRAAKRLP